MGQLARRHPAPFELGDPVDPVVHEKLLPDPPCGGRRGGAGRRGIRLAHFPEDRTPDGPARLGGRGGVAVHVGLERFLLRDRPPVLAGQDGRDAARASALGGRALPARSSGPGCCVNERDDRAGRDLRAPSTVLYPRDDRLDDQRLVGSASSSRSISAPVDHAWVGFARVPSVWPAERSTRRSSTTAYSSGIPSSSSYARRSASRTRPASRWKPVARSPWYRNQLSWGHTVPM